MTRATLSLLSLLLLFASLACRETSTHAEAPAAPESATRVVVQRPDVMDYTDVFTVAGDLSASRDVVISSQIGEVIRHLHVDLGDSVAEGDLLVELDSAIYEKQVMEGEANLTQKLANLTKIEKLFEKKAAPQQQYIAAKTNYDMAEAQLMRLKEQLKRTQIRSPLKGKVVERYLEEGEYVGPGQPILRIVDIDRLKVKVNLPESEVPSVRVGDRSSIKVSNFQELPRQGIVSYVSTVLDPTTRTLPVEIDLSNPGQKYAAGMVADVTFTRRVIPGVPVVPTDALVIHQGAEGIWVVQDGKASFRRVVAGNAMDDRVPILEGLEGSEEVVITGQRLLQEGEKVTAEETR